MSKCIMIVDDEWRTLKGEAERVEKCGLDLKVVALAKSGEEALSLLAETKPDIILCDIRMPGMDGISFAMKAKALKPNLAIIFISGFSDKEYLRTAIRLGAVDYLYKPVDDQEFYDALLRAVKKVDAEQPLRPLMDQQRLKSFLSGENLLPRSDELGGEYMLLVCKHVSSSQSGVTRQILHLFTLNVLSTLMNDERFRFSIWNDTERITVLLRRDGGGAPIEGVVAELCEQMLYRMPEASDHIVLSASRAFKTPAGMREPFLEALRALRLSFFRGAGRLYMDKDVSGGELEISTEERRGLVSAIARGEHHIARAQIRRIFSGFSQNERTNIEEICAFAGELMDAAGVHAAGESASTLAQLLDAVDQALTQREAAALTQEANVGPIYSAMRYIDEHVGGDVSIKAIARHAYLSPTYLCALFKEVTGQTVNQYVQRARIECAKELLSGGDESIGDIASIVGYQSAKYFTKVFLSAAGETPSAYRKRVRHG